MVILEPGQRAPDVPPDTQRVPLEAWIKGWATHSARVGDEIEIETPSGRRVRGTLTAINPGYTHSYGAAVPELARIGRELRKLLKDGDPDG